MGTSSSFLRADIVGDEVDDVDGREGLGEGVGKSDYESRTFILGRSDNDGGVLVFFEDGVGDRFHVLWVDIMERQGDNIFPVDECFFVIGEGFERGDALGEVLILGGELLSFFLEGVFEG